jgi:hypothetical protein
VQWRALSRRTAGPYGVMWTSLRAVMHIWGCDELSHGSPGSRRSLLVALPLLPQTEVAEQLEVLLLLLLLLLLAWHLLGAALTGVAAAAGKHHVRICKRVCMMTIHDERAFDYVPELLASWLSRHAAAPSTAGIGAVRSTSTCTIVS